MGPHVEVSVRAADLGDVSALAAAHRLGQRAMADMRGGRLDSLLRGRAEPIEASFGAELDIGEATINVGLANGALVGYSVAAPRHLRSGESILEISDLWVHPRGRGVGVGSALMAKAISLATHLECDGIDARALPGDRHTKNFFESFGLVARTIEVHRAM